MIQASVVDGCLKQFRGHELMRKLSWTLIALFLMSLPIFGQSRRHGYSPAGGWHRKSGEPARSPREAKKRGAKHPAPTPPNTPPPATH